ncbi:CMD domain-containing protein, partial [Raoultella terrigena]
GSQTFPEALRHDDRAVQAWGERHQSERAIYLAVQLLTRSPDRFSAAQLTPLTEYGLSRTQVIDILAWCGLCGWINRLKIALGNVGQRT